MKHETEPAQVGSKATKEPFRQRRDKCLALWGQPPLAPIADTRSQDQSHRRTHAVELAARKSLKPRLNRTDTLHPHMARVARGEGL